MTDWLVREHARGVMIDASQNSVTISAKSQPRFRANDRMLLASGYGDDLTFNNLGKIASVDVLEQRGLDDGVAIKATIEKWVQLPEETTLGLMQFSLTFVKNLERPHVHFRRAYRKLPESDTQTLVDGEPFVMRTAYYNLLYSLSSETKRTFVRELEDTSESVRDRRLLDDRIRLLLGFIERRILSVGRTLQQLDSAVAQFPELVDVFGNQVTHEFFPGDTKGQIRFGSTRGDALHEQADSFNGFETFVRGFSPSREQSANDTIEQLLLGYMDSVRSRPAQKRLQELFEYE
jgi:hypothetical protein